VRITRIELARSLARGAVHTRFTRAALSVPPEE
jgi:hypothetical protein